MSDPVFVIIRFSVLSTAKENWVLGRGRDLDAVRERLFEDQRLAVKFSLFESLTLPSLEYQACQEFTLVVMTSCHLPPAWKQRLYQLREKYLSAVAKRHGSDQASDFVIEELEIGDYKQQALQIVSRRVDSSAKRIATARLDDDDALHPTFLQRIHQLMTPDNHKKVVSFSGGCFVVLTPELQIKKTDLRLVSAGLTYIATPDQLQTIYCLGRHTRLHLHHEVIENRTPWMYAMSANEYCDTGRELTGADVDLREDFLKHYPFLSDRKV